jgi:tight adherence protein C
MQANAIVPMLLSIILMASGATLIVREVRARKARLGRRLNLISPEPMASAKAPVRSRGQAGGLIRSPGQALGGPAQAQAARICRLLKIDQAHAAQVLVAMNAVGAVLLAGVGFLAFRHFSHMKIVPVGLLVVAIAAILGWLAPGYVAGAIAKGRANAVVEGLPEALELLVVCVEAGLAFEDSLDRIVGELQLSQPLLAGELQQLSADLKILSSRDEALRNLAERIQAPSVRSVVTTLSQTLRYGTPLAQALRVSAAELRNNALLDLEERANRLPTLLTIPMMLFILPTIFLIVAGPVALRLMDIFAKH